MGDHPLPPSLKIIEVCKVAPSPAEESRAGEVPPRSLPLTFFDLLWLKFHPIQRLFFYELPATDISFVDVIVPKLKTSLSLTLRHYLPVAGNLVWHQHSDIPTVDFDDGDGGVVLTVAESDADFYHLSSNGPREISEFHPLVPRLPVSHDCAAVVALQVTIFQNKGFSIGITNHHAIMDGRTSTSFVKSWAQICREEGESSVIPIIPTKLMPLFDRSIIEDPKGLAKIYANAWLNMEGPNNGKNLNLYFPKTKPGLVRSTFEFTHNNMQKLKQLVTSNSSQSQSHISSFALAMAYLCVCTAKLEAGLRDDGDDQLWFAFAADARPRLNPPLPSNYFGNCLVAGFTGLERSELLGENGIVLASQAISKAIKKLDEGGGLVGAEKWGSLMTEITKDNFKSKSISIAGSPRFGVYNADFGWGKPRKVEIVSAETPYVFSLTDCRNGDVGLMEVGVVKERDEMESFAALFHGGFESL